MIIYEGLGGLVLFLAMAVLAIYFYGRMCRDAGYEEGRADHYDAIAAELDSASAIPAGRHAAGQPRALPPLPPEMDEDSPAPGPVQLPAGGAIGVFLRRAARPAAETVTGIDTVLLDPQPAPALNGAEDTGTMARIHLPDATTGAIRAVGDDIVARIERGELV